MHAFTGKHERQPIVAPSHQATLSLDMVMRSLLTRCRYLMHLRFLSLVRVSLRNCAPPPPHTLSIVSLVCIRQRSVRVHIRWSQLETINRHYVRRNERLDHTRQMLGATAHDTLVGKLAHLLFFTTGSSMYTFIRCSQCCPHVVTSRT